MKMTNKSLSSIKRDWHRCLPELGVFTASQFYRIVGPFVTGVRIVSTGGDYCPYHMALGLWSDGPFQHHVVAEYMLTQKSGADFAIRIREHDTRFETACAAFRKQAFLPLIGDIEFATLRSSVTAYSQTLEGSIKGIADEAINLRTLYYGALYAGLDDIWKPMLERANKSVADEWDSPTFRIWLGDQSEFVAKLNYDAEHREEFLSRIKDTISKGSLSKLPRADLIA